MADRLSERITRVTQPEETTEYLKVLEQRVALLADVVGILLDHASEHAKQLVDQLLTPPTNKKEGD
jgi:hypothetical protein